MDAQFKDTAWDAIRQLRKAAYRLKDTNQDPEADEMLASADALADAVSIHPTA